MGSSAVLSVFQFAKCPLRPLSAEHLKTYLFRRPQFELYRVCARVTVVQMMRVRDTREIDPGFRTPLCFEVYSLRTFTWALM